MHHPITDSFENEFVWASQVTSGGRPIVKWGTFSDKERELWRSFCYALEDDIRTYELAHHGLIDPVKQQAWIEIQAWQLRSLRFWLPLIATGFGAVLGFALSGSVMAYILAGCAYSAAKLAVDLEQMQQVTATIAFLTIDNSSRSDHLARSLQECGWINAAIGVVSWPIKLALEGVGLYRDSHC